MGRSEEGIAQIRAAIDLDPLNPAHVAELGSQFLMARQYDSALLAFQKTFRIEPDNVWAHAGSGWVYEQKKMYRDAIPEFETALRLTNRRDDTSLASLGKVLAEVGKKTRSTKNLAGTSRTIEAPLCLGLPTRLCPSRAWKSKSGFRVA